MARPPPTWKMIGTAASWAVAQTRSKPTWDGPWSRGQRDGIISAEYSELTSGNDIKAPFCLHGELGVSMSNSNTFELGTIVSMPDFSMLELPEAGYSSNPGLRQIVQFHYLWPPATFANVDSLPQFAGTKLINSARLRK